MYLLPNGQPMPLRDQDEKHVLKWRAKNADWMLELGGRLG